jgi:acetyl-CoA carboxylase biotin carboxyl carrier protein
MSDQTTDLVPGVTAETIGEPSAEMRESAAILVGPVDEPRPSPSADPPAARAPVPAGHDGALLALVDRLAAILERSDLTELEVEAGGTGLVLRKPEALPMPTGSTGGFSVMAPASSTSAGRTGLRAGGSPDAPEARPSVKAPLTGIWYSAPSPGSPPFTSVGREVAVGQVIGLIEAMKLFNEIKSDLSGRVVRVLAESGQLVKAKQGLIEVEPL